MLQEYSVSFANPTSSNDSDQTIVVLNDYIAANKGVSLANTKRSPGYPGEGQSDVVGYL
jgi:hypothetical protein